MKRIGSRFLAVFVALASGIFSVWLGVGVKSPDSSSVPPLLTSGENAVAAAPVSASDKSDKIELRFKGFQQAKDLRAEFELMNETTQPILYVSYSYTDRKEKNNFCTLAVRQGEAVLKSDVSECSYAKEVALQTLESGESATFFVGKWDVKTLLNLQAIQQEITTQIGFEIFKGVEKRKEIVWSEEIAFPKTLD
jgi:hypothetical protein